MLARSSGARTIVEFGTSFGISTLHLAAALRDNGGGRLITSEFELTTLWGFPCCARFPCVRAAATTPVQQLGVVFAHLTQP